jgi:hypothetical protein
MNGNSADCHSFPALSKGFLRQLAGLVTWGKIMACLDGNCA